MKQALHKNLIDDEDSPANNCSFLEAVCNDLYCMLQYEACSNCAVCFQADHVTNVKRSNIEHEIPRTTLSRRAELFGECWYISGNKIQRIVSGMWDFSDDVLQYNKTVWRIYWTLVGDRMIEIKLNDRKRLQTDSVSLCDRLTVQRETIYFTCTIFG